MDTALLVLAYLVLCMIGGNALDLNRLPLWRAAIGIAAYSASFYVFNKIT